MTAIYSISDIDGVFREKDLYTLLSLPKFMGGFFSDQRVLYQYFLPTQKSADGNQFVAEDVDILVPAPSFPPL